MGMYFGRAPDVRMSNGSGNGFSKSLCIDGNHIEQEGRRFPCYAFSNSLKTVWPVCVHRRSGSVCCITGRMLHPTSGVSLFKTILRVKVGWNANVCLNDGDQLSPSPCWHLNAFVLHVSPACGESPVLQESFLHTHIFSPITQLTHTCFAFKSHLLHWSHCQFQNPSTPTWHKRNLEHTNTHSRAAAMFSGRRWFINSW